MPGLVHTIPAGHDAVVGDEAVVLIDISATAESPASLRRVYVVEAGSPET